MLLGWHYSDYCSNAYAPNQRIGIYGGSCGGYLRALALARNSDPFAAGVDIQGLHDWTADGGERLLSRHRYEDAPDRARALD